MPLELRLLTCLAVAVAVVYWATPLAIRVADRLEFYDRPRGYRGHTRPTPYLGGAALIAGFTAAVLLFAADTDRTVPVLAGVLLLWAVGTVDDKRHVAWWLRVLIEVGLAVALWSGGYGWDLGIGAGVDLALTVFWVVAVVNAFNLFDNMDGQAATMGLVASCGIAAIGVVQGDTWLAVAGASLAGACFGFLPHNLLTQPARIFLGDGGSMPLGFAVAALAMIGAATAAPAWQSLAVGLLLVGVPALDTTLVVVSRKRRRISVLTGGRDHLTHRARQRLRTALAVAIALGSAQIVLSLMAVAAARGSATVLGVCAVTYLVGLAVAVALIDTRIPAVPPSTAAPAAPGQPLPAPKRFGWLPREAPLLVVLGLGAGISPLLSGYYGEGAWAAIGLGLMVVLLAVGIARPPVLSRAGLVTLAALAALAMWSLLSASWADSVEQAVTSGNRTAVLAVFLALMLFLVRDVRGALWALGALTVGALAVVAVDVARLLGPDAAAVFLGGRLDQPLGYINAQGTVLLLALWPLFALAEQRRSAVAAGAGLAGAVVCAGLAILTQSRGVGLAALASIAIVLAVCPGRLRRASLLVVAGLALAAVAGPLLDVYRSLTPTGQIDGGTVRRATGLLLIAATLAGLAWGAVVAFERSLAAGTRLPARRAVAAVLAGGALVTLGFAAVNAGAVRDEAERQYDAFVHLAPAQGGEQTASRLLSGAGNRYDYWRIAVDAWKDRPLTGYGAGNYDQPYFLQRSTVEDIRQPHSLVLQALSELGLPGLLLIAALLGGLAWGVLGRRAAARASRTERGLLVAATGAVTVWAVHTQVDWIHLLPGVTAVMLIGAAVLLRPAPGTSRPRRAPARRAVAAAVSIVPLAIAGVMLSRQVLSHHYTAQAQEALAEREPETALDDAARALRLDGADLQAHYARSAALALQGDAPGARAALEEATRREPGDFVTYALLGDLSVRERDFERAAAYYRQALARNPREPELRTLAGDPRAALQP